MYPNDNKFESVICSGKDATGRKVIVFPIRVSEDSLAMECLNIIAEQNFKIEPDQPIQVISMVEYFKMTNLLTQTKQKYHKNLPGAEYVDLNQERLIFSDRSSLEEMVADDLGLLDPLSPLSADNPPLLSKLPLLRSGWFVNSTCSMAVKIRIMMESVIDGNFNQSQFDSLTEKYQRWISDPDLEVERILNNLHDFKSNPTLQFETTQTSSKLADYKGKVNGLVDMDQVKIRHLCSLIDIFKEISLIIDNPIEFLIESYLVRRAYETYQMAVKYGISFHTPKGPCRMTKGEINTLSSSHEKEDGIGAIVKSVSQACKQS
jgi:hypothetical protein